MFNFPTPPVHDSRRYGSVQGPAVRKFLRPFLVLALAGLGGACQSLGNEDVSDSGGMLVGAGVPVPAAAETEAVGTANADAADDPEIWIDPTNTTRGLIFGTDKQAGLYVYDLSGKVLQFLPEGRLNNVDLRPGFMVGGKPMVVVGASDRVRGGIALFLMDPQTLLVTKWGDVPVDLPNPYGFCMGRRGETFLLVLNSESGAVRQLSLKADSGAPITAEERRFSVGSQTEGCVVDDAAGRLYIGEEARGIWRYGVDPAGSNQRVLIARAPSDQLTPDVEGLTLLQDGPARYLIASSQGDSAFAVWRVEGGEPVWQGRFSITAANGVDAVTGTDGIAAIGGPAGPYTGGLFVAQDDRDTDGETNASTGERQNFKLVGWPEIKRALALP